MSDEAASPTARRGKIASFPAAIREELNTRLFDGQRGPVILPWLNALPEVQRILDEQWGEQPVTVQNLSEWRKGGYAEWLRQREWVEETRILSRFALELAQAGGSLAEGAAAVAGGQILEKLEALRAKKSWGGDGEGGKDGDAEELVGVVLALSKLRDSEAKMMAARTMKEKLPIQQQLAEITVLKFQRDTARLFLKWHADRRAQEILESKESREVKMDRLVKLMFGDRPQSGGPASA